MASNNLPQHTLSHKSSISKNGVLTIHGFGVRVRMQSGHLEIEDGVAMDRRKIRLARVGHRLRRLVCVSDDGFVTLAALKWLAAQNCSFLLLERNGKVQCVTGPVRPSEAQLRRSQALAAGNGVGLEITRTLIDAKLRGEERVLREQLNSPTTADAISGFRYKLASAKSFDGVRIVEANAAGAYFREWRFIPVMWPKADVKKIPDHWRFAGSRQSPLTGGPRLAVTPVHAVLNYCFALLEAETRLSLLALGLDPGLGIGLHTDTANRDSLALDVLEPIRPEIEMWLLNWILAEPLRRSDFFETGSGNCRLRSHLCSRLSETAPTWGRLVAPWAEYVAHMLWAGRSSSKGPATRLTQRHKREAKGRASLPPALPVPKWEHLCRGCGKRIGHGAINCARCAVAVSKARFADVARIGRTAARRTEARAKHVATSRRQTSACWQWDASAQPDWLTAEYYNENIKPRLAKMSGSAIASQIRVSRWYAGRIREGYRPHPRHWQALAERVGVSRDSPRGSN